MAEANNHTGRRSLDRLARDPRITEVWREDDGSGPNGGGAYWAQLADGWNFAGCSTLHEPTIAGLYAALQRVAAGKPW